MAKVFFFLIELFQLMTSVLDMILFDWSAGLLLDLSDNLPINVLCHLKSIY